MTETQAMQGAEQSEQTDIKENRRRFMRQPISLSALVHPDQGRSWLCSIRDFCQDGMLLSGGRGSRSFAATGANASVGDTVALHFSVATPTGQSHFRTRAKIARMMDDGNGLGVSFAEGLDTEAFDALMEFAVAAGTAVPEELPEPGLEHLESEATPPVSAGPGRAGAVQTTTSPAGAPASRSGRIAQDAAQRLMVRVRAVAERASGRLATNFVKATSESLLIRARDAGTNAVEARYLETLDTFEKQSTTFTETFTTALVGQVEKVSDLDAVLERRRKRESGNSTKLELVDTSMFEEWLLVAELISKAENRFADPLLDMRAQLGEIAKPWSHKDAIPIGPSAICWAFDDAQKVFNLRDDIRKEIFVLFEEALHGILPNLYSAMAKLFDDSGLFGPIEELREGLLPKYTVRNRAGIRVSPAVYQDMDHNVREAAMAADGVGPARVDDNPFVRSGGSGSPAYAAARSILNVNRQKAQLEGKPRSADLAAPDAAPNEIFRPNEIVSALSTIQSELGDASLSDIRLKPRLLEVLRAQHGISKGLTEEDYDTLEMMEGLVDSLTDDRLITEGVREWLRRLEITLNKLAAADPDFLTSDPDNPHSAVQMLNQLARLGNGQDLREGIDREVGRRVDELLQRVIRDYDQNPQVFSEVVDELHPLIDRQSRTYRGNVERTVRASEGQQKLARARRMVAHEIRDVIGGQDVPQLLIDLLTPGWRNLMVHTYLRHGSDSYEWRDQLATIRLLQGQLSRQINSDDPAWVEPEALLRRVVDGLNSISFDPSKRTPLIMRLSEALVGDTTGKKAPVTTIPVAPEQVEEVLDLKDLLPDLDPQIETEDEGAMQTWSQAVERARRIGVGEWLATSDRAGRPLILTVAFVGDDSASFVLVNRKGVKSQELSLNDMADALHQGNVTLLDDYDLPLMERASQRMLENMHNQLAFQASHDDLTQLMNRREFERVVESALQDAKSDASQHALLYLDLDQFKIVNNTSGHRAGDELLRVVSGVLAGAISDGDRLARLGGDEYGVLIENVESHEAREAADKLLETIRGIRFDWEGRSYSVTASMGLVFIDQSTESVDMTMQFADEACFSAKDAGRNRVQEYELGDTRMAKRHGAMEWVTQLDQALEEDRLILNCQKIAPVADTTSQHDVHYEILLTMIDELGDVVAPTELINAAETYNRMTTIDRWVIRNVLQWMADNRRILDEFGGFAINVSGHSVNDTTFPDFVLEQFSRTQAPTGKVTFEITETAAIANLENAVDFMNRMRIIGCKFSLDDFGTGLSSYSYLRNLPVDYVKIDGVFVKDIAENLADFAVVRSINEIGHYMGKKTIAEYVENDKILTSLKDIGVDYAQGFRISKPGLLAEMAP
ncbi:MAG: DUF1631 family protein [Pseudomonadota bacterium]